MTSRWSSEFLLGWGTLNYLVEVAVTYQKFSEVFDQLIDEDEMKQDFCVISARLENLDEDKTALFCDLELRCVARRLAVAEPGVLALLALPQAARFLMLACDGQIIETPRTTSFWVHHEELEHRLSSLLPKATLVLREMGFDKKWRAKWMVALLRAARIPEGRMERFTKHAC